MAGRMRSLALVVILVGCGPMPEDDIAVIPDAARCIGGFRILAPQPDLHYAPGLEVYIDESELVQPLVLGMTDSQGRTYMWTGEASTPDPQDPGITSDDRFDFVLTPDERYTLTVSYCSMQQTVTFFTSAS